MPLRDSQASLVADHGPPELLAVYSPWVRLSLIIQLMRGRGGITRPADPDPTKTGSNRIRLTKKIIVNSILNYQFVSNINNILYYLWSIILKKNKQCECGSWLFQYPDLDSTKEPGCASYGIIDKYTNRGLLRERDK